MKKIYPRTGDTQTVYLNAVVKDPSIEVSDYTIYNDFVSDPLLFERNFILIQGKYRFYKIKMRLKERKVKSENGMIFLQNIYNKINVNGILKHTIKLNICLRRRK